MKYSFFSRIWNGKRSFRFLQVSVMTIAIVPLVLVQQVTKNMIESITYKIIETDTTHVRLHYLQRIGTGKEGGINRKRVEKRLNEFNKEFKEPPIISIYHEVRGGGIMRKGYSRIGVSIRGMTRDALSDPSFSQYIDLVQGTLSFSSEKDILLGESVARELGVTVGETVLLLTIRSDKKKSFPKISSGVVKGIFTTGYEELDKIWVLMPFERAKKVISISDQQWFTNLRVNDPFIFKNSIAKRSKVKRNRGKKILEGIKGTLFNYGRVQSWYEADYGQYTLFFETQILLSIVMLIAVILAAITLSSTMGMRVIDLEMDIAVIKSIGADPKALERQLFFQGLYYGLISASLGISIGIGLSYSVNTIIAIFDFVINMIRGIFNATNTVSVFNPHLYLKEIPFRIYYMDILQISILVVLLSICAAYFPVRRLRSIPSLKIIRSH